MDNDRLSLIDNYDTAAATTIHIHSIHDTSKSMEEGANMTTDCTAGIQAADIYTHTTILKSNATTFNVENPINQKKNNNINNNETKTKFRYKSFILQKLKGGLLFIVSSLAIAYLFVASQAIAAACVETKLSVHYWYEADLVELVFYFIILLAVKQFVINAGGSTSHTQKRCWYLFISRTTVAIVLLLCLVPGVYRQIKNDTGVFHVSRKGCLSGMYLVHSIVSITFHRFHLHSHFWFFSLFDLLK